MHFFVQVELFNTGDVIRVIDDITKVHDLQENHGGWVDDMALVGDASTNSAMLYFVVDSLLLIFLFSSCRAVSWSGWSCGQDFPHWRCPSCGQQQDMDLQPSLPQASTWGEPP